MPEHRARTWLVEEGIGEHRALLIDNGEAIAAKIDWPGRLAPGLVADATMIHFDPSRRRGTARFACGEEALVERLPPETSQGAPLRLEIVRSAMTERGRLKRAHAVPSSAAPRPAPTLAEELGAAVMRRFEAGLWEDVWHDAWTGEVSFAAGTLVVAATPGMTVIDIDGAAPPAQLAREAVGAAARAIRRMDLGGSIGIDFPTLTAKADRQAVDRLLGEALADWPHERTAMNGFGFVQIVARAQRPSLVQRLSGSAASAAARMLLRSAERVAEPGTLLLKCHPAVHAAMEDGWLDQLERRAGRGVIAEPTAGLALGAGFAQAVPR